MIMSKVSAISCDQSPGGSFSPLNCWSRNFSNVGISLLSRSRCRLTLSLWSAIIIDRHPGLMSFSLKMMETPMLLVLWQRREDLHDIPPTDHDLHRLRWFAVAL